MNARLAEPPPLVTAEPGCHDCPHWSREGSVIGTCGPEGGHPEWLTSYAYVCPKHPKFRATP